MHFVNEPNPQTSLEKITDKGVSKRNDISFHENTKGQKN